MSNYTKQISWSGKDALSDSDSEKVISGGDFDTEFSAVQTAINSKIDGGTITNFTSTGIDDNATSTAITIDASENVGIGVVNPTTRRLWVEGGTSTAGVAHIKKTAASGASATYTLDVDSSSHTSNMSAAGALRIKTFGGDALVVNGLGNVTVGVGNLVIGTSGKGIDFSATSDGSGTMTSEVLDDYEEGTWTPTINGYSGGSTQTYSTQIGNYTKIGNTVTAHFHVRLSAKGDISGSYTHLRGLPYSHSGTDAGTLNINVYWSLASARSWISGEAGGTTPASIWLTASSNSTGTSYLNTSLLTDTFGLRGTLVYEI